MRTHGRPRLLIPKLDWILVPSMCLPFALRLSFEKSDIGAYLLVEVSVRVKNETKKVYSRHIRYTDTSTRVHFLFTPCRARNEPKTIPKYNSLARALRSDTSSYDRLHPVCIWTHNADLTLPTHRTHVCLHVCTRHWKINGSQKIRRADSMVDGPLDQSNIVFFRSTEYFSKVPIRRGSCEIFTLARHAYAYISLVRRCSLLILST